MTCTLSVQSLSRDWVRPHGPQHTRPPCPSPTPRVHPNPCPLSQWCHPTISSSVVPFFSCPQSFPASGSFPMSELFASGGQSIGVSPRQSFKKQRHHFADKGPYSQSYGFSSSHIWMWELDNKESWVPKNWCFWTVVLKKTLESPLDSKEIKLVNPKGNQPWIFIGRTDAEAETPILWPPHAKNWLTGKDPDAGKDWRQEEKCTTEDEMVGWHHWLNGHEFEETQGDSDGLRSLAHWSSQGSKESDRI